MHFCQSYNQNIKYYILKIYPNLLLLYFFQQLKGISERNHPNIYALNYMGLQSNKTLGSSHILGIKLWGRNDYSFYIQNKCTDLGYWILNVLGYVENHINCEEERRQKTQVAKERMGEGENNGDFRKILESYPIFSDVTSV